MQWTEEKEVLLMREVIGKDVLVHKAGSQERGQGWQSVADTLNSIEEFILSGRSVRDKIMAIIKKYKPLINKDIQGTGLGGDEPTEHQVLTEEIINIHDDSLQKAEEATAESNKRVKADREAALDIRKTAMESMSETAERKNTKKETQTGRKRSGSETIDFLRQKLEIDQETQKFEREAQERQSNMQNQLLANLLHSQQQMMAQQMLLMQELINKNQNND